MCLKITLLASHAITEKKLYEHEKRAIIYFKINNGGGKRERK